ncbi:MAG: SDR family oxidoreductase, partial [Pseudomonadota bacterium]
MVKYDQRWALITGASAGLGAAYANALMMQGANLILVARRKERLDAIAQKAKAMGRKTLVITSDLSQPNAPDEIMAQIEAAGISVDILINNAGFGLPGTYTETSWEAQRDFITLMVTSYAHLTHLALSPMKARGYGRIINVASLAGLIPSASGHTLYGASKAFLIGFTQSLAAECSGTNVNISACCPGFTYTEFHDVNGSREEMNKLPSFMIMPVEPVVEGSLKAVERQHTTYVPGLLNKFLAAFAR